MNTIATGTLIAQARKERNLTQGDLAAALHVSVQAVSKWERGLNFPDITLLEPLGELLGLTVAELMAGERDTPPQEALLQDSLRLGAAQSGRAKKWRRLFIGAAGVLLALVLGFGYLWVRDHTDWLPQKNTVIDPVEIGEMDSMVARVAGSYTLAAFDLTLSDGLESYGFQLEVWDETGRTYCSEVLHAGTAGGPYPRHQSTSFAFTIQDEGFDWHMTSGGSYTSSTSHFDCLSGQNDGEFFYGWNILDGKTTLSPDTGTVLVAVGVDGGHGIRPPAAGNYEAPPLAEGQSVILLRLVCA